MSAGRFKPPSPVGKPYRGDPSDPAPFVTDRELAAAGVPAASLAHLPVGSGPPSFSAGQSPARPLPPGSPVFRKPEQAFPDQNLKFARIAVGVSIASLLAFGVILGPIGIAMGIVSFRRGQRQLGAWAIAAGAAGTIISIVTIVLVAMGAIPSIDELLNGTK
jgi:hypothetical protein